MPLPTNTTIHLPFLIPNNGGYNLFVDGLDTSATVAGLPPSAMVAGLLDLNGDRVPELIVLADRVQEAVGAGIDNVSSTSASWTMDANVENLTLLGTKRSTAPAMCSLVEWSAAPPITRWTTAPAWIRWSAMAATTHS